MRNYFIVFWGLVIGMLGSCEPEGEKITNDPGALLSFSTDTVKFDTIYSTEKSITRRFKAYNPNKQALEITAIRIGRGSNSPYSLIIDGNPSNTLDNKILLGQDSLLILISATPPPMDIDTPYMIKDSVVFTTNGNNQDVKITGHTQDANFLPSVHITKDTTWQKGKPYVIKRELKVDSSATLTLAKGTRIYFEDGAQFIVKGALIAQGDSADRITLRNKRLDIEDSPGQWSGVILDSSHMSSHIAYTDIKNSDFGISYINDRADAHTDLTIENTIIQNTSRQGIKINNADMQCTNVLVNNAISYCIDISGEGNHELLHCTLANFGYSFQRDGEALAISDGESGNPTVAITNTIVWGRGFNNEVVFDEEAVDVAINYCLLKAPGEQFPGEENLYNKSPKFVSAPEDYNYQLDSLSPAINAGQASSVTYDLLGKPRNDGQPDIGAYEWQPQKQ